MPDNKYENLNDRNYTLLDAKQRVIDLMANHQPLPEVGIYDEPVRYFKANEQWCAILFGWLAWLEDVAGWQDAEDELHPGIQAILTFEEGIEASGMATEDDIAKGMYKAFNWLALQVASGSYANLDFSTDENGVVTPALPSSDAGLPEDDPLTSFDETEAARYGASVELSDKIELFLDKVDAYYGVTNNDPTTSQADAESYLEAYFPCEVGLALTLYYDYRVSNPRIIFDDSAAFAQYLYCHGNDEFAVKQWFIDVSAYSSAKLKVVLALIDSLLSGFYEKYIAIGIQTPSNAYLDAACVPIAPQTLEAMVFGTTRNTTPLKASHRMKFRISGYALDVDGDIQDAFWYRTAAGVLTRSNWSFVHSAGNNLPSDNQVVYNSAHIYEYTIDLGALNNFMAITPNKNAGMNAAGLTYPTAFTVEIIDLGLAVS